MSQGPDKERVQLTLVTDMVLSSALRVVLIEILVDTRSADVLDGMGAGVRRMAEAERTRRSETPVAADAPAGERYAAEILDRIAAIYQEAAQDRRGFDIRDAGAAFPKH